jgi:type I restriction enzyme S subunit
MVALKECVDVVSGSTPKTSVPDYWDGTIPWVTPKDLSELDGKTIDDTPRKITQSGLDSCSARLLPPGSVLFSSRAPIGHVAINTVPMATNQGFKSFVPGKSVDASYLYWWLKAHREQLEDLGNGATFKEVSRAVVERVEIPLPPLDEQRRIAAILDQADALRRARRRAIERLNDLGQAIFYEMFGDPVTNPKGFQTGTIESLAAHEKGAVRCGPFGTQLKVEEIVDEGIPLLGIDNVKDNNFNPKTEKYLTFKKAQALKSFNVKAGDVLVTRMGTIGRSCVVPEGYGDARISYHLFRVRPNPQICLPEFLSETISRSGSFQSQLRKLAHGAIMAGLSTSDLKQVRFLIPPLEQQVEFLQRFKSLECQSVKMLAHQAYLDTLFSSLQQRAFRGNL